MKLKNIFAVVLAGMALTGCVDTVPSDDRGSSPESNTLGLYFVQSDLNSVKLKDVTDTLSIVVGRVQADEAVTSKINVTMSSNGGEVNLVQKVDEVHFEVGEQTDTIQLVVGPLAYGVNYTIDLGVDESLSTPYANSDLSFTVYCEDPDAWEVLSDSAIFVNNFWSCILSNSTVTYKNLLIKKYRDKNVFRIYGLPTAFQAEWQTYYQMAPNCVTTKSDEEGLEIDCDMYSDPSKPIKKLYMPFQSLGVELGPLEGTSYTVGEVWAGSVAYNLQSASTGNYLTEGQYPLGTYDEANGVFKFGKIAVDFGESMGIQLCNSEIAIYLDESKMEVDLHDLLFQNEYRAVFKSRAYLNEDGSYVEQGTKIARCVTEDYEDRDKTFRITAPYTSGNDLFFIRDGKRVTFPSGQMTGSTALGGYPILCEAKGCTYVKNEKEEFYRFPMTFYYVNESGKRYDLGTFDEVLEVGSRITYFTTDSLVRGKVQADYIGTWQGEFTYVSDLNMSVESQVTLEADDEYTLVIRGLAPYMEAQYGYDSSLYLDWNEENGLYEFVPQYANSYMGYQINAMLANLDDPNSSLYEGGRLFVGFTHDGRLAFVNDPANVERVGTELNCIVFFTTASGGQLVEPFIPYNFVLSKVDDDASEMVSSAFVKSLQVQTMLPWSSFGNLQRLGRHSVYKTNFASSKEVGAGVTFIKPDFPKFKK